MEIKAALRLPATWSPDSQAIYAVEGEPHETTVVRLEWKTGVVRRIAPINDVSLPAYLVPPRWSLSPDGRALAATPSRSEHDLWILDGLEPPRTVWEKLRPFRR